MKRFKEKKFFMGMAILALLVGMGGGQAVWAESNLAVGGSTAARLDFSINVPTILYLQVGTAGTTIDVVSCDLGASGGTLPGTAVPMISNGPNTVRVAALVPSGAQINLIADSSINSGNLTATGSSTPIPFSKISWTGSGNFNSGTFDGTSTQNIGLFTGSGNRTGTYSFTYANDDYYDSGTYGGRVTYTLSSP